MDEKTPVTQRHISCLTPSVVDPFHTMNSNPDQAQEEPSGRQWHLSPQSEYRFELDPDVTLAIQARFFCAACLAQPYFIDLGRS